LWKPCSYSKWPTIVAGHKHCYSQSLYYNVVMVTSHLIVSAGPAHALTREFWSSNCSQFLILSLLFYHEGLFVNESEDESFNCV